MVPGKGIRKIFESKSLNPQSAGWKSGIKLKESRIPRTIIIQNQSTTDKDCNLVPGFRNPRRGIKNLRLTWISLHGSKFGSVEKGLLNVTLQMKPTQYVSCVTFYYDGTESVYQILKSDHAFKLRKATKDNFSLWYCLLYSGADPGGGCRGCAPPPPRG